VSLTVFAGPPDLDFLKGMIAEHCSRSDSRVLVLTENYKITTCPEDEWNLVFEPDKGRREELIKKARKEGKMDHGRVIPDLAQLAELPLVTKDPKLIKPEIVAVVLYTGPMV
jgi:hypothetical protein